MQTEKERKRIKHIHDLYAHVHVYVYTRLPTYIYVKHISITRAHIRTRYKYANTHFVGPKNRTYNTLADGPRKRFRFDMCLSQL